MGAGARTTHGYGGISKSRYERVKAKSSAPNTHEPASGCNDTRRQTPRRRAEAGSVRSPGAGRAGMVAAGILLPDLDAASPRGQIPPSRVPDEEPATRTAPHYLRLVVISRVRHGYRAREPRGRERKKYSAPVWPDRKSRPAQGLPEALPGRLGT